MLFCLTWLPICDLTECYAATGFPLQLRRDLKVFKCQQFIVIIFVIIHLTFLLIAHLIFFIYTKNSVTVYRVLFSKVASELCLICQNIWIKV